MSLASSPPSGLGPGDPWKAELLVDGEPEMLAEATLAITIGNGSRGDRTFPAKATGKRAPDGHLLYRVCVAFPSEGRWTYALTDGVTDREYQAGTVQIGEPASAPATPAKAPASSPGAAVDERGSSGPPWAIALGGAALLVGARRPRDPASSPAADRFSACGGRLRPPFVYPAWTRAVAPSSESRIERMSAAAPTKIGVSRSV